MVVKLPFMNLKLSVFFSYKIEKKTELEKFVFYIVEFDPIRPHLHKRGAIIRAVYHVRERRFISTWCKHPILFSVFLFHTNRGHILDFFKYIFLIQFSGFKGHHVKAAVPIIRIRYEKLCQDEPRKICTQTPRQECHKEVVPLCKSEPRETCVPKEKCKSWPKKNCGKNIIIFLLKNASIGIG